VSACIKSLKIRIKTSFSNIRNLEYSKIYHKFAENIILNSKKGGSMKKLVFFISLSLLILVSCEKHCKRTMWTNPDVECCGVKDPINNLAWLTQTAYFDEYETASFSFSNYILLFKNNTTHENFIVTNANTGVSWVSIYDCEGNYIDGGHYSIQNQTKFISSKLKNDPPEPCDTCYEFFKTHTLIDTIAYYIVEP
jgi:hypothetical protein